jgi:hypothetical protein
VFDDRTRSGSDHFGRRLTWPRRVPNATGRRRSQPGVPQVHRVLLCQDVCHVIRDHEDNKPAISGRGSYPPR